ncbi:transposase [Streptomyces sp. NPDC059851]|uniref:transposase n=1 Tax=Streptomyces sp. NPDC059851 TaxID=3346971 RepID=UPI00364ED618
MTFPPAVRTVVYSRNLVESMNARLRKATRIHGHFPSEQAALKVLYLPAASRSTRKRAARTMSPHRGQALNQFSLFFEDRLSIQ